MSKKRRISVKTKKTKELLKNERKNLKKDFYELLRRALNTKA